MPLYVYSTIAFDLFMDGFNNSEIVKAIYDRYSVYVSVKSVRKVIANLRAMVSRQARD